MNHPIRRILSLLLAISFVLSLVPGLSAAAEEAPAPAQTAAEAPAEETGATPEEPFYGYIATPHVGTHALTDAYLRGEGESVNYLRPGEPVADLPAQYDSRDYGYITSVKNQNPYGSCWAHAAMGSIEAYMIKFGVPVGAGAAATTSLNLSETQHCFFNYSYAYDAEGMLTGDKSTPSDTCLDQGGNGEMSAYTLMRWTGAADESQSALAYSNASTVNYNGLDSQYAYSSNVCHVQNSVWIPATNVDAVKQAIMEYGAGNISYYETGYAYTYICTIDNTSQDSSNHKWANHAITVVGWDDTIAASNFKPNKPSSPGAWICKNSWGTGNFANGYCYISYQDTTMSEGYIYFYDAEPIDNYQHNYQYDGTCNPVCYGKGWSNSIGYYEGFANDTLVANVFTAKGAETLEAISFCSWDEDLSYTVEIYKNPAEGNPSSGTLAASKSGSVAMAGYYTIPLDTPIPLAAGESFSIVISQHAPVADDNGAYIHTPYDATFNNSSVVSWCTWTHADHGATSYYKEPNGAWTDCPENGDYRIKAYTNDILYNVEAVANNPAWGTLTVSGTRITAEPAEGYYVAGYEVISGTATATININVINVAPASDCVIRIIFAPKPTFTVSFLASGTLEGQLTAQIYDVITLPASIGLDLEDWTFSGWTETQLADETTDKPVVLLPGADYMVLQDTVLYAVFTRQEGSTELVYALVTGEPEEWVGNYVITYGSSENLEALKALPAGTRYEQANNGSTIGYAATGMTLENSCLHNAADGFVWKIEASGSGFTIRSKDNNTYLGCSGTYLTSISPYNSGTCTWTVAYDLYNGATRATNNEGGTNTQYPYLSHSTQGSYFVMNSANGYTQAPPQFWRETTLTTTYYCTDPIAGEHDHVLVRVDPVEPTCVLNGNIGYWRCSICGKCFSDAEGENEIPAASVVIPAPGHTAGDAVTENYTEPTCGEDGGYDTVVYCTVCGDQISRTHIVIPATGEHVLGDWTANGNGTHSRSCSVCSYAETEDCVYTDVVTPPTPTDEGFTTHTCDVCGYVYTDSFVPALGFDYTVHFSVPEGVEQPADMVSNTNTGITLPMVSAPQGYTFLGWVTGAYNNVTDKPGEILTGHYVAPGEITLNALFVHYVGGEASYVLLTAAPADWTGNYLITYGADAAYVMKGIEAGKSYEATKNGGAAPLADTGMVLNGDTLGNVPEDYIFAAEAHGTAYSFRSVALGTYLADRRLSQSYTLRSAEAYADDCAWKLSVASTGVVTLKSTVADANRSVLSFYKNGTGTAYYFRAHATVDNIRLWKEVNTGTPYYTTVLGEVAHEHTPGEPVQENVVPATCTDAGSYDLVVYCTECGEELSRETLAVEALGHDYAAVVTEPTCTEGGFTTYTCSRCGDTYADNETAPLGHAWDEGVVTVEPTETAPGVMTYTCTRCGATREEEIPVLEHECAISQFADVMEAYPYGTPEHEAIEWAFTHDPQITSGMNDTTFGVGLTLTRAQAATFLYAAAGKPEFNAETAENPFKDVKAGKWYTTPVLWAYSVGLVSGMTADTYGVNGNLTRGQIMVILYAWAGKPSVEGMENPYTDVPAGKWFTDAAIWAANAGIENGEGGKFVQSTPCTRESMVLYLYRYLEGKCLTNE